MKKLCVILAVVLLLGLCGCQEQEQEGRRRRNRDKETTRQQEEQLASYGRMGYAVDTGSALYYWQYDPDNYDEGALMGFFSTSKPATLVCRDEDGNETPVLESDACEFAVTKDAIFYQVKDFIWKANADGSDRKELTAGSLVDIDPKGRYLITELDGAYHSYSIEDDQFTCLINAGTFEGFHDGVVYYSTQVWEDYDDPAYANAQKGMVTLRAVNVDGSDDRLMVTTQPDLYKNSSGYSTASIQQIRFGADGVYFSYGSIAGSGGFFQGGKIMRVAFDGSSAEVVAGQNELVDANFGVREDGTVSTSNDQDFVYYEGHTNYYVTDGILYWMDPLSGMARKLTETAAYNKQVDSEVCYVSTVEVWDDTAVFTVNYANLDPQQAVGWRDYAVRVKTVTYMLENGKLTELYSF